MKCEIASYSKGSTVKVYVINEPFVKDFCRTQRWAARTRGRVLRPPDWLAYCTAVLEQEGFETRLFDFPARGWEKDRLREVVREGRPDVVVLDTTTPSIYSDIECASICKEEGAQKVIFVGPHASVQDQETLEKAGHFVDAIARGEYEITVRDIVRQWSGGGDLEDVTGATYRDRRGVIRRNPDRPLLENLDSLPFPAWHHLEVNDYFDGTKLYPFIDLIGGRGCPFQCTFCLWPQVMHGSKYRLRSPGNIIEEMERDLAQWPEVKKGEFFFEDDTFTVNRKRAREFCDMLINRDLNVKWSINCRADLTDFSLLKRMKQAGCRMVLVGYESGDQVMLDRMKKGTRLDVAAEFTGLARKAGLKVHGCFVFGLPGETRSSMERTLKFALDSKLDTVQFSAAVPFPGTKYYENCKEEGLLLAQDWSDWLADGEQSPVVSYPGLSGEEVSAFVDHSLKRFYFRPTYMAHFLLDTRSLSDLYRKVRGAKNFVKYLVGAGT